MRPYGKKNSKASYCSCCGNQSKNCLKKRERREAKNQIQESMVELKDSAPKVVENSSFGEVSSDDIEQRREWVIKETVRRYRARSPVRGS